MLRLATPVSGDPAPADPAAERSARLAEEGSASQSRWAVWAETRGAATITPHDARWILAVRTSQMVQGRRAGIITPDARARLLSLASGLGLRPFDANLVIAIVQDGARRGEPLDDQTRSRLTLVHPPAAPRIDAATWWAIVASLVLGGVLTMLAVRWLIGA